MTIMKWSMGIWALVFVALIAVGVAVAHLSCLILGPQCYSVQMAPSVIIESAQQGTLLAPLANVLVSGLFVVMALYALSAAKLICTLPYLNAVIYLISALCIIRGLLPLQLWLRQPDRVSNAVLIVGILWLVTGVLMLLGYRWRQKA